MSFKNQILVLFLIIQQVFTFQSTESKTEVTLKLQYDYGVVKRQVDGDTIIVNIEGEDKRVRLLGVDTPESVHPTKEVEKGQTEQSQFTKKELTGRLVILTYDDYESNEDFFGRLLQYVWIVENDGTGILSLDCFNKILIEEGHSPLYTKYKFGLIDYFKE